MDGAPILERLKGRHAIGHVRYSTAGGPMLRHAQPICANTDGGPVSIAHNGNLVNAGVIRRELEGRGAIFGISFSTAVDGSAAEGASTGAHAACRVRGRHGGRMELES